MAPAAEEWLPRPDHRRRNDIDSYKPCPCMVPICKLPAAGSDQLGSGDAETRSWLDIVLARLLRGGAAIVDESSRLISNAHRRRLNPTENRMSSMTWCAPVLELDLYRGKVAAVFRRATAESTPWTVVWRVLRHPAVPRHRRRPTVKRRKRQAGAGRPRFRPEIPAAVRRSRRGTRRFLRSGQPLANLTRSRKEARTFGDRARRGRRHQS